jgi:hypothetical protein
MVEVPIYIETPILEVVEIPVERIVTDVQEREKVVEVRSEVLKIEKTLETVEKIEYEETKKIIEKEPDVIPEVVVERLVKVVEERPVEVFLDRFVDRIIEVREVVPVEQRVEVPIEVQVPVEIITNKPIFYKQPVVQIDVQRVEREKLVEIERETIKVEEVPTPYLQMEKEIVELPGETIVLHDTLLHIVEVEKETVIAARDIEEKPVEHYLDIHKAHVIDQQTFVVPEKEVVFLEKPYGLGIEKPLVMKHEQMVVVEKPETILVKTREGLSSQIVKTVTQEKVVPEVH